MYGDIETYFLQACNLEKRSIQNLKQLVLEQACFYSIHFLGNTCCNKEKFESKVLTSILNKSNIFNVIIISLCQVRLLYREMLLPKNVERRQWVNRNDRIKVFLNVAGNEPMLYSAKTRRGRGSQISMFIRNRLFMYVMTFTRL